MATKLKQITIDQFMAGQSRVIADSQELESAEKPQKKRGRKFQNRTISKEGGIIVYLEERHKRVLRNTLLCLSSKYTIIPPSLEIVRF